MGKRFRVCVNGSLASAQGILSAWNGAGVGAAGISLAFFKFRIYAGENRSVILPGGKIEKPSARAIGRRIPICSALNARKCRLARRLRCEEWPPVGVEAACPIHLNEWVTREKFACTAVQDIEESIAVSPQHQFSRAAVPI